METFFSRDQQVVRISVLAELRFLPDVLQFVHAVAVKLGLPEEDAARLELVAEEACVNVIQHAFEPGESATFDVIVLRRPGQVVTVIEDRGKPFAFRKLEAEKKSALGTLLMKAFADQIQFLNLGDGRKRVELVKNLPVQKVEAPAAKTAAAGEGFEVRPFQPAYAAGVAALATFSSGPFQSVEMILCADRMREAVQSGRFLSCVAVSEGGSITGHLGLRLDGPSGRVGVIAESAVEPEPAGLFRKMLEFLLKQARMRGMYGIYCETRNREVFKEFTSLGGIPTGFWLSPYGTERAGYLKLNYGDSQTAFVPFHHKGMITRIYEEAKLNRDLRMASSLAEISGVAVPTDTILNVTANPRSRTVFLRISEYGVNFEDVVFSLMQEFTVQGVETIYLDLPLTYAHTQIYCVSIEALGFSFAGIIPELFEGDVLRLQYVRNAGTSQPADESGLSKDLLNYVIAARG